MSFRNRIKRSLQIAQAVNRMHVSGYVHKDLKPENILIHGDSNVKLIDLGLCKSKTMDVSLSTTAGGEVTGTKYYMAAEQLIGKKSEDSASDIYALCLVIYEIFTESFYNDSVITDFFNLEEKLIKAMKEGYTKSLEELPGRLQEEVASGLETESTERPPAINFVKVIKRILKKENEIAEAE